VADHGTLKWLGTAAGVAGALVIALNLPWSGWGFALFLVSSLSWGAAAVMMREPSLAILQVVFTVINVLGIWRWLLN
jgi:drug/metabolite transporter (DMT)-like permease